MARFVKAGAWQGAEGRSIDSKKSKGTGVRFWFYCFKASWRVAMGRWYVWRDAPTDIVRQVAVLWYHNRRDDRDESSEVIRQAYQEYKLRRSTGKL